MGVLFMPTMSYLAYSLPGEFSTMLSALSAIPGCEVIPAENQEIAVIVTTSNNQEQEETLHRQLSEVKELKFLAMTYGHLETEGNENSLNSQRLDSSSKSAVNSKRIEKE